MTIRLVGLRPGRDHRPRPRRGQPLLPRGDAGRRAGRRPGRDRRRDGPAQARGLPPPDRQIPRRRRGAAAALTRSMTISSPGCSTITGPTPRSPRSTGSPGSSPTSGNPASSSGSTPASAGRSPATILDRLGWERDGPDRRLDLQRRGAPGPPRSRHDRPPDEDLGVEHASAVAKVGDAPADLQEGTNAGCGLVVGVTWGSHSRSAARTTPPHAPRRCGRRTVDPSSRFLKKPTGLAHGSRRAGRVSSQTSESHRACSTPRMLSPGPPNCFPSNAYRSSGEIYLSRFPVVSPESA